jgi:hypothetical protein
MMAAADLAVRRLSSSHQRALLGVKLGAAIVASMGTRLKIVSGPRRRRS